MRTAVLAVLVAADMGMTAKVIAANYNVEEEAVEARLTQLKSQGAVYEEGGLYYAENNARPEVTFRTRAAARQD